MTDRKKIMFYETPDRQIKFRIRCEYEGITQSQFLRLMVTGCIDKDPLIEQYLAKCKSEQQLQSKKKQKKISSINKLASQNIKKFALDEEEIEDIFDMIEVETNL